MTVRIPLPDQAQLTPEIAATLGKLPPLNVFRMMANAPASFEPIINFAMSILLRSEFDKRKREIAVLRVAHVTRSNYEWTQHVAVAKSVGVSDNEIAAIGVDGAVTGLDAEGNLLCRVADEISRDVRLSDEALGAIMDRYGVRQATELILCCSYFNMLSRFLESTRVELESQPPLASARRGENS
ncbi:MAG: carboxymuconolactone decarboxylase family protein [Candidatus Binatus sp.]|jgi:alkylhydroperoxidase family enzyme|uniref:carboxymuconolactone decarboxylase family protein n=1 Tax=Candidatus Binatus sp. TaxID=2811406 RepID=UPI003D14D87D